MIGIKFKIQNKRNDYLNQILKDIGNENDKWKIEESEIYIGNEELFKKVIYSNNEFKKTIQNQYYTVFCNIQLYKEYNEVSIETYQDFMNSNCLLILFVTDNEFVQVYSKSKEFLNIIKKNAEDNLFLDIKDITKKSEIRHLFSAYTD